MQTQLHISCQRIGPAAAARIAPAGPTHPCCTPPPLIVLPTSATTMSFQLAQKLIFLQDTQNNFLFLVDSGASLSILPHVSTDPPSGPHLVGANGKTIPTWGFHRLSVCFTDHTFDFEFLLAAVATPLLGMDLIAKFGLTSIPSKQQFCMQLPATLSPRQVHLILLIHGAHHRYSYCSRSSRRC